ncbi:alpha/beta hydrolase family protein [Leptospira yasudae]|uniref:alpha/beta hydrolase family protein n=1 Tax=Leptospira yasudae TaxID=2202201 RepID=UPI001090C732|nr:alpha/beta hydrolase [Leptospira yasudae]MBW0433857.1 alpha/beta hydrolase [Leptospira yasudae]TGM97143.1 alpha/beta hydrolase [Leptospira yasudae]
MYSKTCHLFVLLGTLTLFLVSGVSCKIPEDLKKKPDESLLQLKESGATPSEVYLKSGNRKLYGVASGCKTGKQNILIFIHGSPGGWQNYAWYLENKNLLAKYCILSLDRPGFGNSNPGMVLADVEAQATSIGNAIHEFLKSNSTSNKKNIVIVGHSYGGPIAARIASDPKNHINVLVLLAAPLSAEHEEIRWYNQIADWAWVKFFLPVEIQNSNDEMLPLKNQLYSLEIFWTKIQSKIILIHGRKDSLVPFKNLEYFRTHFLKSQLTTIALDEEDHFIPWTQKNLVEKVLLDVANE